MIGFFLLLQVLQYKKRCGDLEQMMQEKNSEWEKQRVSVSDSCRRGGQCIFPPPAFILLLSFALLVQESSETSNGRRSDDSSSNLEDALIRLEEEQQRCGGMATFSNDAPSGNRWLRALFCFSPGGTCLLDPAGAAACRRSTPC